MKLLLPLAMLGAAGAAPAPAPGAAEIPPGVELRRLTVDERLRPMGPDGWHRIALHGNWDFIEPEVWRWIVSQPDCDRATALTIFWKAQPDFYLEYEDRESVPAFARDDFELVSLIRERWLAGAYRRSELAFDRDRDFAPVDLAAIDRRWGARAAALIPASMRASLDGRRLGDDGPPLPGTFRN